MTDIQALLQQRSPLTPKQSVPLSGYGAPAQMQDYLSTSRDMKTLATLASDILADPQALALFSERVYDYL